MIFNKKWSQAVRFFYKSLRRFGWVNFDPEFYLLMSEDVRRSGIDPFRHWVDHGRHEGRPTSLQAVPDALDHHLGSIRVDAGKKNLLLVSHEASLTGAPILCLNLLRGLAEFYNVHVLLLKDGPLRQDFVNASCSAYVARSGIAHVEVIAALHVLEHKSDFDRVIVNSVVSHTVLRVFAVAKLQVVFLVHEFASYVSPLSIMEDIVKKSKDVVFSAPIILDDARRLLEEVGVRFNAHILPQGKCEAASVNVERVDETARIRSLLRPESADPRVKLIIGAGTVCFRKGVDLFIQAADLLRRTAPEQSFKFVWVGHGYDPRKDTQFSAYLEQQVQKCGLGDHFAFLGEVSDIDYVYGLADALWLTSRLDPLPNVGIDAICRGLPIFCFKNASGIADVLVDEGVARILVPEYLDPFGLAQMTHALFADESAIQTLSRKLRDIGSRRFSMKNYVESLVEIVEGRVVLPDISIGGVVSAE
jgi:glycosyltransferase involved in cell wall biosynthesis